LRTRSLVLVGLVLAIFLPPSLSAFLLGAVSPSLTGVYLMFYVPTSVVPSLLFFILLYLLSEGAIMLSLVRQGAGRAGWLLVAMAFGNLLLGIIQYQTGLL